MEQFGLPENLKALIINAAIDIALALLVLFIGFRIIAGIMKGINAMMEKKDLDPSLRGFNTDHGGSADKQCYLQTDSYQSAQETT